MFDAVMPVMETRHDEDLLKEAEAAADIGVDEGGVDVDHKDVGLQRRFLEAEHEHRRRRRGAQHDDLQEMHARAGDPVEAFLP